MTTDTKLTVDDISRALADERHLGWGYTCTRDLGAEYGRQSDQDQLDRNVVAVANELGLDYDTFFHWTNSKYGRWLADAVIGRNESVTEGTVRGCLNREAVAAAMDFDGTAD